MDPQSRKQTLRLFSNGVYILTARNGEQYGGATVTWVTQASFHPPLLVAAIRRDSNVFRCLQASGAAALHIVAAHQQDIAQRFFTPTTVESGNMNGEPFHQGRTTVPILDNALAYVECGVQQIVDGAGDHAIVVFEVLEAVCREPLHPLTVSESPWQYGG